MGLDIFKKLGQNFHYLYEKINRLYLKYNHTFAYCIITNFYLFVRLNIFQCTVTVLMCFIYRRGPLIISFWKVQFVLSGAGVAQQLCNGLPRDNPGFNSQWEWCKNRASCPSQGTVNGGAVSKWPRCRWDVKHNRQVCPVSLMLRVKFHYRLKHRTFLRMHWHRFRTECCAPSLDVLGSSGTGLSVWAREDRLD